jgi:hypothetical protein
VRTGAHHHGELESVMYVVRGGALMRWGDRLQFSGEAGPNASPDEALVYVLVRSGQDPIVVNLEIAEADKTRSAEWVDDPSRSCHQSSVIFFRAAQNKGYRGGKDQLPGMPRLPVPQAIATLCLSFGLAAAPAYAQERPISPLKTYANVLRVINPHLPDWQRRKYAASLLANAQRTRIDPRFIMAIVTVESSWRSNAVSRSGARGLGQLMPSTAAELDVDARDASDNLRGTSLYLRSLLDRFHGQQHWFEKAIAGYNAGPYAVMRYGGIPPYAETQRYVVKVMRVYQQLYGRVAIAPMPQTANIAYRRDESRRVVEPPAGTTFAAALNAGADIPILADAYALVQIPAFKSSF